MDDPEDLTNTAHHIVSEISDHADFGWDGQSTGVEERAAVTEIIKAALLAERISATERAAKIAEEFPMFPFGGQIAAAIRSQP